jgi:hypothetical protein
MALKKDASKRKMFQVEQFFPSLAHPPLTRPGLPRLIPLCSYRHRRFLCTKHRRCRWDNRQRRAAAVLALHCTRSLMTQQAEEYIERAGLAPAMKDAVLLLLENRSRDLSSFLRAGALHSRLPGLPTQSFS